MLKWAAVFFILSLIAGFLGFFGTPDTTGPAKILFFAFLAVAMFSFVFGLRRT